MNYSENRFMNELRAALEGDGVGPEDAPHIEDVQDGQLQTATGSNDESGNPEGPGDTTETADPGVENVPEPQGSDPLLEGADDPSGNPETPGDDEADPASESFTDLINKLTNPYGDLQKLPTRDVVKAFLDAVSEGAGNFNIHAYPGMKEDAHAYLEKCMAVNSISEALSMFVETNADGLACVATTEKTKNADGGSNIAKMLADVWFPRKGSENGVSINRSTIFRTIQDHAKKKAAEAKAGGTSSTTSSATEAFEVPEFLKNVDLYKKTNVIEMKEQAAADDESGNPDDPTTDNKQTPVSPAGDTKPVEPEGFNKEANDPSGNAGDPSDSGTPVSKGGTPSPLPKTAAEKVADDSSGNPDGPGVDAEAVDKSFESFIDACERSMVGTRPGCISIPDGMSLESYAMELGMHVIVCQALEADLSAAERRSLPDSAFGLPEERKWPLHDEDHVRSAIKNFHWCPKDKQRQVASAILKAMRKYKIKESDITVSEGSAFLKFAPGCNVVPRKKPSKG